MMKYILMLMSKKVLLLGVMYASMFAVRTATGESLFSANGDGTHFAEHFIASGSIYTGMYFFMHDGLGCNKWDSFIFSATTALVIGFTYKYMEGMEEGYMPHNFGKAMIFNGIGVAVPAIVLWRFNL